MRYEIDLSAAQGRREIHDILARVLKLPDYYGRNLDALWDCLTETLEIPCEIRLTVRKEDAYQHAVCDVLEEVCRRYARRGQQAGLTIERIE